MWALVDPLLWGQGRHCHPLGVNPPALPTGGRCAPSGDPGIWRTSSVKGFPALRLLAGLSVPESVWSPGTKGFAPEGCGRPGRLCLIHRPGSGPRLPRPCLKAVFGKVREVDSVSYAASGMTAREGQVPLGILSKLGWALPPHPLLPMGPHLQSSAHTGL